MSTKTPVEILTEAKRILIEGTWGKGLGGVSPPRVGFCALTAVAYAGYGSPDVEKGATDYLGRAATDRGFMAAHLFNDAPETTFNDVMSLYDDAILLAKEDE